MALGIFAQRRYGDFGNCCVDFANGRVAAIADSAIGLLAVILLPLFISVSVPKDWLPPFH